jgi:hypothetical protein
MCKFERIFEEIKKKKKDSKETLRRCSFRNTRRQANPSEQVGPISISDFKENCKKDNLQQ